MSFKLLEIVVPFPSLCSKYLQSNKFFVTEYGIAPQYSMRVFLKIENLS